eukprot:2757288-Amphidinium_carterae.1
MQHFPGSGYLLRLSPTETIGRVRCMDRLCWPPLKALPLHHRWRQPAPLLVHSNHLGRRLWLASGPGPTQAIGCITWTMKACSSPIELDRCYAATITKVIASRSRDRALAMPSVSTSAV